MAHPSPDLDFAAAGPPKEALLGYIEDMLLELTRMAASAGETRLAASLAVAALQASARGRSPAAD